MQKYIYELYKGIPWNKYKNKKFMNNLNHDLIVLYII